MIDAQNIAAILIVAFVTRWLFRMERNRPLPPCPEPSKWTGIDAYLPSEEQVE